MMRTHESPALAGFPKDNTQYFCQQYMFAVCTAAAIGNAKVNLLLQFEAPPAASQVLSRGIAAFSQLQQDRGVFTPFFVNCAMVFDDASSRWVPLERSSQIVHNCQIYLFQPDVPDVAGPIPDPIPASTFLVSYRSPERSHHANQNELSVSPRGLMPADPDLSGHRFQERQVPLATSSTPSSYGQQQQQYASAGAGGGVDNSGLTPLQRAILQREADKGGSPYVSGGSILRDEREKEEAKVKLPVDTHRTTVRDETRRFAQDVSPQRSPQQFS